MQLTRSRTLLWILALSLPASLNAQASSPEPASKIVEKDLTFPSPIQWSTNIAEISLLHVAWGPANSPEILSKGRQKMGRQPATVDPDRPYVLALGFRAKSSVGMPMRSSSASGVVRIRDADGNAELPIVLASDGFPIPGNDVRFDNNTVTEYWDLFPAAPDQREFLFQVSLRNARANNSRLFFKIILQGKDIVIVNVSPLQSISCTEPGKDFAGTIGASTEVTVHLVGENATVTGTEQYQRIGETLWLKGSIDSLGNFVLEERYPEDHVTGIFKGKFSGGCQVMQGYFSKPDGSRLQPFELHQVSSDGRQRQPLDRDAPRN